MNLTVFFVGATGLIVGVLAGILIATWRSRKKRESLHLELAVVRAQDAVRVRVMFEHFLASHDVVVSLV